ncbi:hypothetical protein ACFX2U_08755 [Gilliamella apicola]|uniref:hypothetical protein n=1 Tax=Gilliamella apicola TaxID=1196095 RepID=UPI0015E89A85|nr:hypothetical protein [Gilliamella apicola]WLS92760.1 hypothetical protein RAM21_06365 [Gilliamella apicola]
MIKNLRLIIAIRLCLMLSVLGYNDLMQLIVLLVSDLPSCLSFKSESNLLDTLAIAI